MRKGGLFGLSPHAMAALAVALLSLASVNAGVMQARASLLDGARGEMCRTPPHRAGTSVGGPHQAHKVCATCEAAATPPLFVAAAAPPTPGVIAWTPEALAASLGARGPPSFEPNARGPPPSLLTT